MSFYTFIVIEVKKEVYKRLFNHWVSKDYDFYLLPRPKSTYETDCSFIISYCENHAPEIEDLYDYLSDDLGMDQSDFYI